MRRQARRLAQRLAVLLALAGCAAPPPPPATVTPALLAPAPRPTPPPDAAAGAAAPQIAPQIDSRVMGEFLASDGARLPVQAWLPADDGTPRAVILALHGFNDYANAFDAPGRYWAQRGIATYAYDQRGFGRNADAGGWAGTARMVADVDDAAHALARRWPGVPLYLLGESMGGAVLLAGYAGRPLPPGVRGLILTAPAVWARATMPFYQRWGLAVANHLFPWLSLTPPRGLVHVQASDNIPMMIALGRDPLAIKATRMDTLAGLTDLMDQALEASGRLDGPALVLYGEHEELIPDLPRALAVARIARPEPMGDRRLADQMGETPRLGYYPLGWHMLLRDLNAAIVWRDVLAWIDDPTHALPSGADTNPRLAELIAKGRAADD